MGPTQLGAVLKSNACLAMSWALFVFGSAAYNRLILNAISLSSFAKFLFIIHNSLYRNKTLWVKPKMCTLIFDSR
jgi:hypothetical protein